MTWLRAINLRTRLAPRYDLRLPSMNLWLHRVIRPIGASRARQGLYPGRFPWRSPILHGSILRRWLQPDVR